MPRITAESRLRYRQRIKPNVDSAADAIHNDLQAAEEIDTDRVTNAAALVKDEALYVLDEQRDVVQTVLRRYDR